MTFGAWGWWGCHPHAPAAFIPRKCSWYSFSLEAKSTIGNFRFGRNMSLKNPVTPPGIDSVTVRLLAQLLNHYATPGPQAISIYAPRMKYAVPMNIARTSGCVVHSYVVERHIQTTSCPNRYSGRNLNLTTQNLVPSLRMRGMWNHTYSPVTSSWCHPSLLKRTEGLSLCFY
jgi:hypothetical protein